jgi:tRNA pseudouridine32 synthase/23S rRNA pseudouridine746 synthase/23S rRNA pseudouridine955/2504/2580 synthase
VSGLELLARERGWLAVEKPPGALVISGRTKSVTPPIRERLEEELGQKVFVVHRLDRDTSGVLIFALDAATHRALSLAFESGQVEKHYLALVRGRMEDPVQIDVPLAPARKGRMRTVEGSSKGAKQAATFFRPLELFDRATLVDALPRTGRTHQIRLHLLYANHPLLVDPQYRQPVSLRARELGLGSDEVILERTPLHAAKVILPEQFGPGRRIIEAPLPADFARVLQALREAQAPAMGPR